MIGGSDVATRLRVFVTASNAAGSTTAESEATGVVSPTAPVNVTPPRILGAPNVGVILAVDEGQWSGTEPFDFTYRWQRCERAAVSMSREKPTRST